MAHAFDVQEDKYTTIVKTYVGEKLRGKGLIVPGYESDTVNTNIVEIAKTLRRVGDELESSNLTFFSNMCDQLQITRQTAQGTFLSIANEIFSTGTNWGRIVAFLTFGSNLAVHCATSAEFGILYVDEVVKWISCYMSAELDPWITRSGGWNGFLTFFDRSNREPGDPDGNNFVVSAIAGIGVGALLMMALR